MKKRKHLMMAGLVMLLTVMAVGCGDDKEDRLEEEVDRLEQQVTDLQKEKETAADPAKTEVVTDNTAPGQDDFSELEAAVNAQVEKVAAEEVNSDEAKKVDQYFSLKKEIEALDQKLDVHDDYLESQYRQNSITMEELKTQEQNLDTLENKLDEAEDHLEIRFGMDS